MTTKQLQREAKKLFRLCVVGGTLDEGRTRQTVREVLETKRRGRLMLLAYFLRLLRLERLRRTAEVQSATLLATAFQSSIISNLERRYGPGLNTSFALNPALIGGLRIQVGSDVYDGSVRGGLAALQKRF
jgi:F-type H+-transporting ATPase subunit delta